MPRKLLREIGVRLFLYSERKCAQGLEYKVEIWCGAIRQVAGFHMRRRLLALSFISLLVSAFAAAETKSNLTFFDLEAEGFEQYQDVYFRGEILKKASYGERFLDERFAIVNSVLRRFKRPFTLLDIGAAQGYFSIRGAETYPESVFVMLEGSNPVYPMISRQLASIVQLNHHLKNLRWIDKPLALKDLKGMSAGERFDVTLLLNIVHWFPDEWKEIIDTVYAMSQVTILEVPPLENSVPEEHLRLRKDIHGYLSDLATRTIRGVPRHTNPSLFSTYYVLENKCN